MSVFRVPTLVANLLPDRFFSAALARIGSVLPSSALGAPDGVAQLDFPNPVLMGAQKPANGALMVIYATGWPATRAAVTTRADIHIVATAPTGTPPPTWLLDDVDFFHTDDTVVYASGFGQSPFGTTPFGS